MNKLALAKAKLMVEAPYFGIMSSYIELVESQNCESFLSNANRLEVNSDYLESLSLEEAKFILSNAAMHRVLDHERRQDSKMTWLWQLASDYAINAMLVENGMHLPDKVHYDKRFSGKYAEEIYAILKDEIRNEAYDDNEANESGFNEQNRRKQNELDNRSKESQDKAKQIEGDTMQALIEAQHKEALKKAYDAGKVPQSIERLISKKYPSQKDWRMLLAEFLQEHLYNDFTSFPPNKKLLYTGVYLPSLSHTPAKLGIAVDTSASISQKLLEQFVSEIEAIRLELHGVDIELFMVDAKVQSHQSFYEGEMLEIKPIGGGGTRFDLLFDYVQEEGIVLDALLYFTDGAGVFPKEVPDINLLWVLSKEAPVPFGESLVLAYE